MSSNWVDPTYIRAPTASLTWVTTLLACIRSFIHSGTRLQGLLTNAARTKLASSIECCAVWVQGKNDRKKRESRFRRKQQKQKVTDRQNFTSSPRRVRPLYPTFPASAVGQSQFPPETCFVYNCLGECVPMQDGCPWRADPTNCTLPDGSQV